ncbi:RNA polymerase sigma-70 factor [Pedobacter hiemivivus]|uniref:RNA polymerase sigma-70 factor n=1 Tax=Pedobacter hiemivivus TaxID=2530454 RepID=A0A4U1GBH0_9SPHI|nr:RNA polymerase sigma-70 factor [Pedobacter hiemivivus]TCC95730.1 RNA polymerase sigma-70 factor [Pedobacter hiemivivus]TKC61257.1 RNA polymerase sigma-70 factor [Pedobacter hiemivivus]
MPVYQSLTDAELFSLLCNSDHKAYTEIYDRYSGLLYVHAYKRIRNREEARDLIHELFSVLWSKRDQIILKTELSAYLYRAVRNRVIDLVNHSKLQSSYISSFDGFLNNGTNITDHVIRQKELSLLIEKEIDSLPEKMKQVFNLSRNEYRSHKEISETLEISELTVRKQINNALKVLRPKLSKLLTFFFL